MLHFSASLVPPPVVCHDEDVFCLYDRKDRDNTDGCVLFTHPYVPRNFDGKTLCLCTECIENWAIYRVKSRSNGTLNRIEERNEGICALCSDQPHTVVVCEQCVRSYCYHCLNKILTKAELKVMKDEKRDWVCMACANGDGKIAGERCVCLCHVCVMFVLGV